MIYQGKLGSRITANDAQVIGERLTLLAAGEPLQPERVVDDARPEQAPLHRYFEWDDQTAAEAYRVDQARYYLRNIEIVRQEDAQPIRAFHVVTLSDEPTRGYASLNTVMSDMALLAQVIEREQQRLESVARTLAQYEQLTDIVYGLRDTISQMKALQLVAA